MNIKTADFVKGIRGTNSINDDGFPHVAFLGRSNVGKSSVINMLCNRKSLVKSSATPGKTKEINFFKINEEFYFVDLPGYGYAKISHKERDKLQKLINWYLVDVHPEQRTLILVIDAQVGLTDFDREIMSVAHDQNESLVVLANKMDKLNQKERHKIQTELDSVVHSPVVFVSATKKRGRDDFFKAIFE